MNKEVLAAIEQLNVWTQDLIGKNVASVVTSYDRELVHLEYGDKKYDFNPNGYNMLYIMKVLYNNPVLAAVME